MSKYRMHLASLRQPLSSCLEYLYDIPQITALFRPWGLGGAPGGAWPYGEGGGGEGVVAWWNGGGGAARGSAMFVTAWQRAQRMDLASGGSCNGVWQPEQLTSIIGGGGGYIPPHRSRAAQLREREAVAWGKTSG